MARYQVILAYDGSRFQGFQRQAVRPGELTVQGVFEAALQQLGWQGRAILAAGRTDRGVHAAGQVVAFDLEWKHSPEALQSALNAFLPADVVVQAVRLAAPDFHPRYGASRRRYSYHLYNRPVPDPLLERYAWRVWPAVELEALQGAAHLLVGGHDFAAFGTPPRPGGNTVRTVFSASWRRGASPGHWNLECPELVFEIAGNAFLYRMVRRLVSVQVAVGQGRLGLEQLMELIQSPPGRPVHGLAPAHGLVLVEVTY